MCNDKTCSWCGEQISTDDWFDCEGMCIDCYEEYKEIQYYY